MEQSQGGQAVSDTPRMKAAQMAAMENMTADVWRVGFDLELELNDMKQLAKLRLDIIRQLEAEKEESNERIKRLKNAGNNLANIIGPPHEITWATETEIADAYNLWIKVNEDNL